MKNTVAEIFTAVFLLVCALPFIGMFVRPTTETLGNSVPREKPTLFREDGSFETDYPEKLGDYLEDRLFLRAEMITADAVLREKLFGVSSKESVIAGTDSWLYYEATLDDYQHTGAQSGRGLFNAARNLRLMQDYTELLGKKFLFAVAPNKNSLYPEHMPDRYRVRENAESDAERLAAYLEQEGVHSLDLFRLFKEQEEVLYYARDSHWNEKGAVLVFNAMLDALGIAHEDYADVTPKQTKDYVGDLARMLYPAGSEPEVRLRYLNPSWEYVTDTASPEENYIRTACASGEAKLLMYRDSFGNSLLPYLAEQFEEAVFSRVVPYTMTELVTTGADVLIVEKVERHLPTLSEIPPVMSAPVRDPAVLAGAVRPASPGEAAAGAGAAPEKGEEAPEAVAAADAAEFRTETVPGYRVLKGALDTSKAAPDPDTPILCLVRDAEKTALYEAFCVTIDNNDFGYTAYISDLSISGEIQEARVYARSGGVWTEYAEYEDISE